MQRRGAVSAAAQLQAAACSSAAIGAAPLAALLQRLDAAGQRCGIHADTLQAANEQQDAQQQQQQQQHQQRRRLSHCAATPSGRASSDPAHGRSRRGLSTSAAAAAAAQRSSSGAPSERSYSAAAAAAEPALAFDAAPDAALPHVTFSDPAAAAATAARLRAQANARLKAMTLADPQPRRRMVPAADEPGEMELRRVAVPLTNGSTPERPVWERLAAARAAADAAGSELQSESAAALQLYRQEVLHGHDPEVSMAGGASGFVHVPFLRSGMFAAHQGYSLQSELSRARLQSRLAPTAAGAAPHPARPPILPGLTVALASQQDLERDLAVKASPPVRSDAHLYEEIEEEQLAMRELLEWEEARRRRERAAAAAAAAPPPPPAARAPAAHGGPEDGLSAAPPAVGQKCQRPDPPSAPLWDVLHSLARLPGLDRTELVDVLYRLYGIDQQPPLAANSLPYRPLNQPADPAACLEAITATATALQEDLGAEGMQALVKAWPWVLAINPAEHGPAQLEALHVLGLGRERRAQLLLSFPGLLQADVEGALLPLFEYLEGLGMRGEQIADCLAAERRFASPAMLPRLKAIVAFLAGKGMSREDICLFLTTWPQALDGSLPDWELKLDWLADHVGFTAKDAAHMPCLLRRSLVGAAGPRIAFLLSHGRAVMPPSEMAARGKPGPGALGPYSVKTILKTSVKQLAKACHTTVEDYERFKQEWLAADFPAWLEQRRPGIEHYRAMTQKHRRPSATERAAAQRSAPEHYEFDFDF